MPRPFRKNDVNLLNGFSQFMATAWQDITPLQSRPHVVEERSHPLIPTHVVSSANHVSNFKERSYAPEPRPKACSQPHKCHPLRAAMHGFA